MPRVVRVPLGPDALLGVAGVRGKVIPVLSLSRMMGLPDTATTRIVITDVGGPIGLAVGSVSQVERASENGGEPIDVDALVAKAMPQRQERRAGGASQNARAQPLPIQPVTSAQAHSEALVVFVVSGQDFALPASAVADVGQVPAGITTLPETDPAVLGTAPYCGAVLPVLSLTVLLALPPTGPSPRSRLLVVRIGTHRVGLIVDAVRAVERVSERDIDPLPQALVRGGGEARIAAICRLDEGRRLLRVLDVHRLLREDFTATLLQNQSANCSGIADPRGGGDHEPASAAPPQRLVLLRIGDGTFALPIGAVDEVALLPPRLAALPGAPGYVRGVMHVRGQAIAVIDQMQRFGDKPELAGRAHVVVVRSGKTAAGFAVSAVLGAVEVLAADIHDAPDLGTEGSLMFSRTTRIAGHEFPVLIIDPQVLLAALAQDVPNAVAARTAKAAG